MTEPLRIQVVQLFISPGHNYFGRHGQTANRHATIEVPQVECVAGRGLLGDRFFDYQPDYGGQVTFFAAEVFDELCRGLNLCGRSPGLARRNVITRGMDLNSLIEKRFELQGVLFEGVRECSPCYWMDQAIGPGAETALRGRGGLRARILTNGRLRVDGV